MKSIVIEISVDSRYSKLAQSTIDKLARSLDKKARIETVKVSFDKEKAYCL